MTQALEELQVAIAQIAERVGPSVVGLGRGWGRGSGVVIAPGRVLTNAHVLRGEAVAVTFGEGESRDGRVAGADEDLDVAVVAVDTGEAPAVAWEPERAGAVGIGTAVLALANPGGRGLRVTPGTVSAAGRSFPGPRGRRIGGSIEHTAPLPRGSSGGPLVDLEGRLLGLNTVRMDGGLILALPADAALQRRTEALAAGEATARPRLGVALAHPRAARRLRSAVGLPDREGLLVRGVVDGSPAARAGIERGDLLVAAGGAPLRGADDLFDALEAAGADGSLVLTVVRGADEREVTVELATA
jgi:S1-C subfamily serine protease